MPARRSLLLFAAAALLSVARDARAEWVFAAYLGGSWTAPATLTVDLPSHGSRATWPDVPFDSRSLESPPYYGYRIGWFPSRTTRFGAEGELIHLKVYARPGALGPAVQRFSISHGLNLVLANVIWRQPIGAARRIGLSVRGGAGFAVPRAESDVFGMPQEQYEVSSLALQAAVGPQVRIATHLGVLAEYKLTTANPSVSVSGGTIKGRFTSQHLAAGLEVRW